VIVERQFLVTPAGRSNSRPAQRHRPPDPADDDPHGGQTKESAMLTRVRRKPILFVLAMTIAGVLFSAGGAVAATTFYDGRGAGDYSAAARDDAITVSGTTWVQVLSTGGVNWNLGDTVVARFSAEATCFGGTGSAWCSAVITFAGVEMSPAVGTDFAFDSTDGGAESNNSWEARSFERVWKADVAGENGRASVAFSAVGGCALRVDDMVLSVQVIPHR
jgi:hypothetical protein